MLVSCVWFCPTCKLELIILEYEGTPFSSSTHLLCGFFSVPGGDTWNCNVLLITNPGLLLFFLFLLSHGIYIYSSSSFRKTISPQFLASCFPSLTEYMTNCCIPGGCFYLQSLNYYTTGQLCLLGPLALFTSPLMWFFLWVLGFIFLHLTCL